MPVDVRRHLFGSLEDEVMRSAGKDDELRAWKERREPSPHRHGTDGVRVSPQQQHGNHDLAEALGEVSALVGEEPARQAAMALTVSGTPILGAERRNVDSARCNGEHEMSHEARLL